MHVTLVENLGISTTTPSTPHIKSLLQYLLETSLQQQQVTQELIKGLQVATQELLQQRARTYSLPGRLPNPCQEALLLLHKLTPADNSDAYFYTFEQTVIREDWPEDEWAQALAPLLTREAQLADYSFLLAFTEDYSLLKEQILGLCRFSICCGGDSLLCALG